MTAPVLLIAIGNESRGDDALGPLLLRQLQAQGLPQDVEAIEDFQLQVEHAADLAGRERVLFVDAGMNTPAPYDFYRIDAGNAAPTFSHAIAPQAVLATYTRIYDEAPPPAFVLCLRGERFELGEALSPAAVRHLAAACKFAHALLQQTDAADWQAHCTATVRD